MSRRINAAWKLHRVKPPSEQHVKDVIQCITVMSCSLQQKEIETFQSWPAGPPGRSFNWVFMIWLFAFNQQSTC